MPHLATPTHPESAVLEQVVRAHQRDGVPNLGLRDGQVHLVDSDWASIPWPSREAVGQPVPYTWMIGSLTTTRASRTIADR